MRSLPRPNEEIFDSGVLWTPDKMPQALDAAFSEIEAAIGAAGGTGSTALAAFLRNGRLINAPLAADDSDQFLPPSPSLAITLPAGLRWVQDGALVTLEDDVVVAGLAANFEGWVQPLYDAEEETFSLATFAARPALGIGVLAYVTTDADAITAIDASEAQSDVIPTLPLLLARLRSTEGGSGGGDGIGRGDTIPWTAVDTRSILQAVFALLAERDARFEALVATGGVNLAQMPMEQYAGHMSTQDIGLTEIHPDWARRSPATRVVVKVYGDSSGGSIDDLNEGTATVHEDGTIGP